MTAFETHMQALAKDFIGTVLFVDDQLPDVLAVSEETLRDSIAVAMNRENSLDNAITETEILQVPYDGNPVHDQESGDFNNSHLLKIKELSLAFSESDILFSPVYTPSLSTEDEQLAFVGRVCRLARKADVIVLDWELEKKDSQLEMGTTARQIIDKYKSDNKDRDILFCIFSAKNKETVNPSDLSDGNVFVFYVSKKDMDAYSDLPNKIVSNFAKRHEGILPSAALSAIKVIRDNTHRILSLYSAERDTSYLSHRCLLPRPEDAEVFATERPTPPAAAKYQKVT